MEGSLCLASSSYPAAEKCWPCPRDFSRGMKGGGASGHPLEPPPLTWQPPRAEPCHGICCSKGPCVGQHSGACLKCRFLSPAPWDRLLSLFTRLSSDCGPLRWGLCPRIRSSWMGVGGRLREDADRQLAQRQGEKPQGKAPGFHQQRELWAFKPPGCPQPARQARRKGFQKALPGAPHLGVQNSACCLTTVYFLSSSFTGCQLSAFLFFSLSPTLSSSRALSLDKRATETERMESELEFKNGPLDHAPPQPHKLNPSLLFSARKQPWGGERMCAGFGEPGTRSRDPPDSCFDAALCSLEERGPFLGGALREQLT